jgi:hypothetical protein
MTACFLSSLLPLVVPVVMTAGADALARLEMEARFTRQELETAQSGSFYLVVDEIEKKVFLKIRGVELRAFVALSMELGEPAFTAEHRTGWADVVCDFERPPQARQEAKPGVNPLLDIRDTTGEDEEAAPPALSLGCPANVEVYFVPDGARRLAAWLWDRLTGRGENPGPTRLRIRLQADEYRDLYRTIPGRGKIVFRVSGAAQG